VNTPRANHNSPSVSSDQNTGEIPARVLAVSENPQRLEMLERVVRGRCEAFHTARSAEETLAVLAASQSNLILIDRALGEQDGIALAARILDLDPSAVPVILADSSSLTDAVLAMQTGAADLIDPDLSEHELRRRLSVAGQRASTLRRREDKMTRLKNMCHTLNTARDHVSGQVGDLCNDLLGAYQTMAEQIGDVSISSELNSLLRQELDVESLLRTVLEFLLCKIGSTNAAVFLPASTGEFSLGAYINYDCPKDAAEVLLDQMAYTFAPCFEDQTEPLMLHGRHDLQDAIGDEASWLGDSNAIVVSCVEEGDCLAVLTVFRQGSKPFTEEHRRVFEITAKLFGAQLGRVIQVHHRHLPEEQWFEDESDDGLGGFDGPSGFDGLGPLDDWDPNTDLDDDYGLAA
jgi:DNA-binding response OmpR family regulator